jgi:hypothetical protein
MIYALSVLWLVLPLSYIDRVILVGLAEYFLLPMSKIQSCDNDENNNEEISEICGNWTNDTIPAPGTPIHPFDSESHRYFLKRLSVLFGKIMIVGNYLDTASKN